MDTKQEAKISLERLLEKQLQGRPELFEAFKKMQLQDTLPELYVGRISGSCIYRVGLNHVADSFDLKFRAPGDRDRFMMRFERLCQQCGYRLVKSY
ncbi:hypothetical protein JOC36_000742 [Weissella uvarum]|uniref:hypothetical protein n=1 Tax=Weissella uvarum TaxID=1479233 RepID=UPI00195F7D96|nr:hypothetical protein [Weissella uvarum]MBM7617193.1 hypothetical protein [Weissella uvarum]MCM0595487.1 hypothetical protein [Weissella uvarum]